MQLLTIEELGLEKSEWTAIETALTAGRGLVVFAGIGGSGKANTQHTAFSKISGPGKCLIAGEDVATLHGPSTNFIKLEPGAGRNLAGAFKAEAAKAAKSILVDGLQNAMEVDIALKAAAAGHLVLGTMDTPDTAATLAALGAMCGNSGPDAALLASTLTLVTAQRLLRRPCRDCAVPAGDGKGDGAKFEKGSGCATCNQSGYKGRTAAYEVMPMTPALAALLKAKAGAAAIHAQAVKEGMRSMRDAALAKMRQGLTTMAEVRTL